MEDNTWQTQHIKTIGFHFITSNADRFLSNNVFSLRFRIAQHNHCFQQADKQSKTCAWHCLKNKATLICLELSTCGRNPGFPFPRARNPWFRLGVCGLAVVEQTDCNRILTIAIINSHHAFYLILCVRTCSKCLSFICSLNLGNWPV